MDIVLLVLGFVLMIAGILGSFVPVIPGPPLSWVGLLMLHLTEDWFNFSGALWYFNRSFCRSIGR